MNNNMMYCKEDRAMDAYSDEQLCRLMQDGNREAEEHLVIRYFGVVKSCSRPFFLAGGDGEDLIQEGMLGLIKAMRAYDPKYGTPFQPFARMCITRQIYSAISAAAAIKHEPLNRSESITDSPLVREHGGTTQTPDPVSLIIGMEEHLERRKLLSGRLSVFEDTVLSLYLEGDSYEEIATAVGKSVKSVDNAIQRIRRKAAEVFVDVHR